MKTVITTEKPPKVFQPVTMTVTFETAEELNAFYAVTLFYRVVGPVVETELKKCDTPRLQGITSDQIKKSLADMWLHLFTAMDVSE